jgi:hypothetical protein
VVLFAAGAGVASIILTTSVVYRNSGWTFLGGPGPGWLFADERHSGHNAGCKPWTRSRDVDQFTVFIIIVCCMQHCL